MHGALPEGSCRIAFLVSVKVEISSSRAMHSISGSLLIVLSLIAAGRLSTLLQCSVHLSNLIQILFVRSVLPYALSGRVVPELWAINRFQCIVGIIRVVSICKRLGFFCFLAQPGTTLKDTTKHKLQIKVLSESKKYAKIRN